MANIVDLSTDILNLITGNLEWSDLLQLRPTCKTLCRVSQDRVLWLKILEETCKTHEVVEGTFIPEQMSQKEIESAALGPYRFSRALWKHNSEKDVFPFHQHNTLVLDLPDDFVDIDDRHVKMCHLTAGGRYLVVIFAERWLEVWDLKNPVPSQGSNGQPYSKIASLKLLADIDAESGHLPGRFIRSFSVFSEDGQLLVLIDLLDPSERIRAVYITHAFKIEPSGSTASITLLGKCPVANRAWMYFSCGTLISLQGPEAELWTWNLATNRTQKYLIDRSEGGRIFIRRLSGTVADDYFFFVYKWRLLAWKISALNPNIVNVPQEIASFPAPPEPLPFAFHIPWDSLIPYKTENSILQVTRMQVDDRPRYKSRPSRRRFDIAVLKPANTPHGDDLSSAFTLSSIATWEEGPPFSEKAGLQKLAGDRIVQSLEVQDQDGGARNTFRITPEWKGDQPQPVCVEEEVRMATTWIAGNLPDGGETRIEWFQFDTVTGRHVFWDPRTTKIQIVDILAPR